MSLWCVVKAVQTEALGSPTNLLLGAIYFLLCGQFGIALQNYCARVARNIEAEDAKKSAKRDDVPA